MHIILALNEIFFSKSFDNLIFLQYFLLNVNVQLGLVGGLRLNTLNVAQFFDLILHILVLSLISLNLNYELISLITK